MGHLLYERTRKLRNPDQAGLLRAARDRVPLFWNRVIADFDYSTRLALRNLLINTFLLQTDPEKDPANEIKAK